MCRSACIAEECLYTSPVPHPLQHSQLCVCASVCVHLCVCVCLWLGFAVDMVGGDTFLVPEIINYFWGQPLVYR